MQISTWQRVTNKFKVNEMGQKRYVSIGEEAEFMIYGDGETPTAQLKSLKNFFGQIWEALDTALDETREIDDIESERLSKSLSQWAVDE